MGKKLKLVSVLLIIAVVFSLASIGMSLSFKNYTPIVSGNNVEPIGNVGLIVEKNSLGSENIDGNLEVNNDE